VLLPARPNTGVVFLCGEGPKAVAIPACVESLAGARLATRLASGSAHISTVEHLLATLSAGGFDNVTVETRGEELPVLDGSALGWVELLRGAGRRELSAPRRFFEVRKTVEVVFENRRIRVSPGKGFSLCCEIDFPHPAIGRQRIEIEDLTPAVFERELAPARTFGFESDVETLRAAGLARGASLENTVVLGDVGILNPEGLRWPDEFVRHKALDLVGDLALLGGRLRGRVEVERGGHGLHHALLAALRADPDAGGLTDAPDPVGEAPA
ncbi:MAG: UDP-3-O-acyl-N-acetylglucosamine deacetylase, partial [Myxococcota bacterium]